MPTAPATTPVSSCATPAALYYDPEKRRTRIRKAEGGRKCAEDGFRPLHRLQRSAILDECGSGSDESSEPGCSRNQKEPGPDNDHPDRSRDALTGRCETLDGDR